MVTKREPGSFANLQRTKCKEFFDNFGRSDFSLITITVTTDAGGRMTGATRATVTISGDFQFVTVKEKQFIDLGLAVVGDGIFYTGPTTTINENDELIFDNVTWILTQQVEGEQTKGVTIYQGWVAKRKAP